LAIIYLTEQTIKPAEMLAFSYCLYDVSRRIYFVYFSFIILSHLLRAALF